MRESEFRVAVDAEFGAPYARVVLRDVVLHDLRDRTAEQALRDGTPEQALRDGVPPRDVWASLCEAQGVPESRRHGAGLPDPRD